MFDSKCPSLIPSGVIKKVVILFHGYGSNGEDLLEVGKIWQLTLENSGLINTAFFSPNAVEVSEVNPTGGYQWFGLPDFSPFNILQGLEKNRKFIKSSIDDLMQKYKLLPSDIIIMGFSQGAMVALDTMLLYKNLGGVLGYSGAFYPPTDAQKNAILTPVLLVHGTADCVVPYAMMVASEAALLNLGINVVTKTCNHMGHSIDHAGILAGSDFIKFQFKNQPIAL